MSHSHTFLFQPALWIATGTYTEADGTTWPSKGESRITHKRKRWVNESFTVVDKGDQQQRFDSGFELKPPDPDEVELTWKTKHPALGELRGLFVVFGDLIVSSYVSGGGVVHGVETIQRVDDDTYHNQGFASANGAVAGRWTLELRRQK